MSYMTEIFLGDIERLEERVKELEYDTQHLQSLREENSKLRAERDLLKQKLTQDPKDARCQLYKQTQKYSAEAKRLNAETKRLKEAFNTALEAAIKVATAHINEFCDSSWNDACTSIRDDVSDLLKGE